MVKMTMIMVKSDFCGLWWGCPSIFLCNFYEISSLNILHINDDVITFSTVLKILHTQEQQKYYK
jgi:hypothetical protein